MKFHIAALGIGVLMFSGVTSSKADVNTALLDNFESNSLGNLPAATSRAWRFNWGAPQHYQVRNPADSVGRDPGFGTGNYLTNQAAGAAYDDYFARPLESAAHLSAGGKIVFSFDYAAKDSSAYNLRFGIYGGSAMVQDNFTTWGGAMTDANALADWNGYLGSLALGISSKTSKDSLYAAANTSGSNFFWGTSGESSVAYGSAVPVRNDGLARTAVMELSLDTNNVLTINLYEGAKGALSATPIVTKTINNAANIITDYQYVGFGFRSSDGAAGTNDDYIAFDNIRVNVVTADIPEPATFGFILAGGASLLFKRRGHSAK